MYAIFKVTELLSCLPATSIPFICLRMKLLKVTNILKCCWIKLEFCIEINPSLLLAGINGKWLHLHIFILPAEPQMIIVQATVSFALDYGDIIYIVKEIRQPNSVSSSLEKTLF